MNNKKTVNPKAMALFKQICELNPDYEIIIQELVDPFEVLALLVLPGRPASESMFYINLTTGENHLGDLLVGAAL